MLKPKLPAMRLVEILRLLLAVLLVVGSFGVQGGPLSSHAHTAAVVQHAQADAIAATDCHKKYTQPADHQPAQGQQDQSCSILCCAIAPAAMAPVLSRSPGRIDRVNLARIHDNWATAPPAPPPRA